MENHELKQKLHDFGMRSGSNPLSALHEIMKVMQEDEALIQLYHRLNKLRDSVIPKTVKISETEFMSVYPDEFCELEAKIEDSIKLRISQIKEAF